MILYLVYSEIHYNFSHMIITDGAQLQKKKMLDAI